MQSTRNNSTIAIANNGGPSKTRTIPSSSQRQGNWDHNKVMALIKCKHVEHAVQKESQDPHTHMVHVAWQWNKIMEEL
jgi:hypothetical protein